MPIYYNIYMYSNKAGKANLAIYDDFELNWIVFSMIYTELFQRCTG